MANRLKELGSKMKFTVYPESTHNSRTETYNNPKLYIWLQPQKKK